MGDIEYLEGFGLEKFSQLMCKQCTEYHLLFTLAVMKFSYCVDQLVVKLMYILARYCTHQQIANIYYHIYNGIGRLSTVPTTKEQPPKNIWTRLFGPVYLDPFYFDPSIWTCRLGPVYLDPSTWTRLFKPVYLDPSIGTRLIGPVPGLV